MNFQTLEALKAIGNAGIETETLINRLRQCITDESGFIPMEVRVAAIDAHRRLPSCEKSRDEFFLNNYRNFSIDTELRIASYLQVMRCPDYNVVKVIRRTLENEEINQGNISRRVIHLQFLFLDASFAVNCFFFLHYRQKVLYESCHFLAGS